jgi:hypothetical protein
MKAGDVFHLPDWAGGHINVALEVCADGSVITCNFTDYATHSDWTCIIEVGEHPSITKKSVVNYRQAQYCESGTAVEALERLIDSRKQPLSPELLARIRQGALDSPRTSDKIKDALRPKNEKGNQSK